jgi:sugar phosphate isomerase/epimerase
MRISVVTDEISADIETALELAGDMGLDAVEIRGIEAARYPFVSDYWRDRVPRLIDEFQMTVAALSPGLFKLPWPSEPLPHTRVFRWEDKALFDAHRAAHTVVQEHLEVRLPAAIEAAKMLGAPTLVCFSFAREPGSPPGPAPDGVIAALRSAAQRVAQHDLQLAIEVEHVCWGDTGSRTAEIVERVDHPALGINWDPANAFKAGVDATDLQDDYAAARKHVCHVHFKDAVVDPASGHRGFAIEGQLAWDHQIAALRADGYDGYISVETHARPKIDSTRRCLARLRNLLYHQ